MRGEVRPNLQRALGPVVWGRGMLACVLCREAPLPHSEVPCQSVGFNSSHQTQQTNLAWLHRLPADRLTKRYVLRLCKPQPPSLGSQISIPTLGPDSHLVRYFANSVRALSGQGSSLGLSIRCCLSSPCQPIHWKVRSTSKFEVSKGLTLTNIAGKHRFQVIV